MDRAFLQTLVGGILALVLVGGTVALVIIQELEGKPIAVPDVLSNLDFGVAAFYFATHAVQNGARAAGVAAAQVAVAMAQKPTA